MGILGGILVLLFNIGNHITVSFYCSQQGKEKDVCGWHLHPSVIRCHLGGGPRVSRPPYPHPCPTRAPPEPSGSSTCPRRHPQLPPSLPEAGGRAPAPRGHHPNSYNQQPCQDFKLTQLSCEGKKTQNENKLTCLHRSCCSNTHSRTHTHAGACPSEAGRRRPSPGPAPTWLSWTGPDWATAQGQHVPLARQLDCPQTWLGAESTSFRCLYFFFSFPIE